MALFPTSPSSEKPPDSLMSSTAKASHYEDEGLRVLAYMDEDALPGSAPNPITEQETEELVKRVDWRLMPILCVTAGLQYSDKSCLSIAALFGIIRDLHLFTATNGSIDTFLYSQATMIFYVGYVCGALPLSALAQRLPTAKACSLYILLWGITTTVTPACTSFPGLMVQRFFLGFIEAGVSPAFLSIVGMWYTKKEQALRSTILFSANGFTVIPLLSVVYGLVQIGVKQHAWKQIYYFLGGLTILWAFFVFFRLPDSPIDAKFLSPRQRYVAVERLRANQSGITSKQFKPAQALEAIRDPRVICLALLTFCIAIPGGALGAFAPLVINSVVGATPEKTLLLLLPSGVISGSCNIIAGLITTRIPSTRVACIIFFASITVIGFALQWKLPLSQKAGLLIGVYMMGAFSACLGTMTGLVVSNSAGASKKTTVGSIMFACNALSNIAAPFFFFKQEAPRYPTGFLISLCILLAGIFLTVVYFFLCRWENSKRDKEEREKPKGELIDPDLAYRDLTDVENRAFRYVL